MQNATPAISVIVPIYNVEQHIERCFNSIAQQTFRDFEVIFVDDCSPDGSVALLEKCLEADPETRVRCRLISHEANKGVAVARNTGMNNARGTYVIHVDSDDYVHPDFLANLYAAARDADADMVICDFFIDRQGQLSHKNQSIPSDRSLLVAGLLTGEIHNSCCNKLVRRSIITNHEIYTVPGINFLDDKSVAFKIAYFAQKVMHLPEPLYYYNWSNTAGITKAKKRALIPQAARLVEIVDDFFQQHPADPQIDRGISVNKALVSGMILLHGTAEQRCQFMPLVDDFKLKSALEAKTMPWHYKLFVLFHKCRMGWMSALLRMALQSIAKIKTC